MKYAIRKKAAAAAVASLCLVLTAGLLPAGSVWSAVRYMPNVTAEMSHADYWAQKVGDPDRVQVSEEEIEQLNQEIWKTANETRDLAAWPEEQYDAVECVKGLLKSARADADYCYNGYGAMYDQNGKWQEESVLYDHRIENCRDATVDIDSEEPDMRDYLFAICTTRSTLLCLPTDEPMLDTPSDPDYDVNYLSIVRVNEPLVLRTMSADGQYYAAMGCACSGWIRAEDVAICANKQEWLEAWDYPSQQLLVVYDDKIYTEDSNFQPETANRKLPMGTCLQLATEEETQGRISNRTAHNNHAVWMPVRKADGTYEKKLALIGENRKVSEGYLPLTARNVVKVALNQLGDAYGWGGMMGTNDCSGYVRDVYKCFGVEMPRSSNRNNGVAMSWNLGGMTDEEKTAFIKTLPPGTQLSFTGHEMLYLGYEGDKLYVISSVSNVRMPGDTSNTRIRGGVINTLDILRASNTTWLHNLDYAEIPYYSSSHAAPKVSIAAATVTEISSKTYTGKAQTQTPQVRVNGTLLTMDQDYSIAYKNNVKAGTASMTITGIGIYRDTVDQTFTIGKAANTLQIKGRTVKVSRQKLKQHNQTVKRAKAIKISKKQGKMTYRKVSVDQDKYINKIRINQKTGEITVKKGARKGTCKVTVKVIAAGNDNYKAKSKTTVVTIRIQ